MLVNISEITVKRRVRKDLGDLEALKDSLRRYGLLNPITLNSKYELIAGERRLEAAKAIGWTSINASIIDNASPAVQLEMEIEENNQRKIFTDAELLEGYRRLDRLNHPNIFVRIWNAIKTFFLRIRRKTHR
ncbi:MAG: ParB N-terminal domain-containing protein [Treponema sp.]|jgi:ParB family chromosome partitioning protein|nr:ParB N-terminal domain-containing protein [Treponema sp.]